MLGTISGVFVFVVVFAIVPTECPSRWDTFGPPPVTHAHTRVFFFELNGDIWQHPGAPVVQRGDSLFQPFVVEVIGVQASFDADIDSLELVPLDAQR